MPYSNKFGFTSNIPKNPSFDSIDVKQDISVWSEQGGGWHDVVAYPRYRTFGANLPSEGVISGSVFTGWQFALNDWMQFDYHILHDYVPGSAIYPHVHWVSDGTDVVNTVKWQFDIAVARGHQQAAFNFASPTTLSVEQASTGQHYHMITEIADPGFSSAELEIDSLVCIRITRVTNGGTDNTDGIYMLKSDIHYQSNGSPTKNKAPDFYT